MSHEFLDINHLKTLGTPHYFGLGFIQLKINDSERLHFYHPDVMPILDEEEIHNHRYNFRSCVIRGALYNELFTYHSIPFAEEGLYTVSCKREDAGKPAILVKDVESKFLASFTVEPAQWYELTADVFHRIKYSMPTITHLVRGPILTDVAMIIKKQDMPDVCPFSKKMEEGEIWEIIEKIIND